MKGLERMIDERIFVIRLGRLAPEQWAATVTEVPPSSALAHPEPGSTAHAATPWDAAKDALAPILPDIDGE